ncbi:hypothetical protein ES703_25187 [subsurface metagenome]
MRVSPSSGILSSAPSSVIGICVGLTGSGAGRGVGVGVGVGLGAGAGAGAGAGGGPDGHGGSPDGAGGGGLAHEKDASKEATSISAISIVSFFTLCLPPLVSSGCRSTLLCDKYQNRD